jgi:serine/threonine-protein kinase
MAPDLPDPIGPYRIVDTLGEGGMGVVYLAEQLEPVRRRVALKVLKPGVDSAQVLRRFEAERQALAVMDHPSIAKIFGAGRTDHGQSYFAMELVEGSPITGYCDENRLTVRERAALFVDVCHAVQHAHQKGVIHRDLKPSNVLVSAVDGRPLPRIIDFGIAKATTGADFDGTQLTRDDQIIGTPAYMSPEQIDGSGDIDTRTDIYALGVLLYQLVVGALPFDRGAYQGWAAIAATLYRDPPRPARRFAELGDARSAIAAARVTSPAALARDLSGDLGWVVLRAMDSDRDRRYETAVGFALDLDRYLSHEPVRAREATTAYVARKFLRRHWWGVAFGATVVLGLTGFAVTTAIQADRIARARDEAEARRGQAEGVLDFMLSDLRTKLEPMGRLDVLDDVGNQALAYFASLPEELFTESELLSRSQALYQIGSVRLAKGMLPSADTAFAESLRLARELSARDPTNEEWLFGLGAAEFWAGELARRRGDVPTAHEHFLNYRDISVELVERDPGNLSYLKEQGYSHTNLGVLRRAEGRLDDALGELEAALDVKRRVVAADSSAAHRYDLSRSYNTVGLTLSDLGRLPEATEYLFADVALKEALLEEAPDNATFKNRLSVSLQFLGDVLWASGDVEGALGQFQRAEELLAPLVEQDPDNAVRHRALVIARGWMASLLAETGREGEALETLGANVVLMRSLSEANPEQTTWASDVANQLRRQGEVLLRVGRAAEAEAAATEALEVLGQLDEATGLSRAAERELMWGLLLRGDALAASRRPGPAHEAWERAYARARPIALETGHRVDREILATALLRLDRTQEARTIIDELTAGGFGRPNMVEGTGSTSG